MQLSIVNDHVSTLGHLRLRYLVFLNSYLSLPLFFIDTFSLSD